MIEETEFARRMNGLEAQMGEMKAEVKAKMGEVARDVKEMREDMRRVRQVIWEGNGQPPIVHQVRSNAETIQRHLNETTVRHARESDRKWDVGKAVITAAITFILTAALTLITIYATGGRP